MPLKSYNIHCKNAFKNVFFTAYKNNIRNRVVMYCGDFFRKTLWNNKEWKKLKWNNCYRILII